MCVCVCVCVYVCMCVHTRKRTLNLSIDHVRIVTPSGVWYAQFVCSCQVLLVPAFDRNNNCYLSLSNDFNGMAIMITLEILEVRITWFLWSSCISNN